MSKSKKLIFFGSGLVGLATLKALGKAGFEFEAIITKGKAIHHRGTMPVLEFAKDNKIAVHTPKNKSELSKLFGNDLFTSQAGLVVDYGLIIPKEVIDYFPLGILNSHFSLLPQWRGADPITFALLSGQKQTGVSIMLIEPELDTGPLLAQADYSISPDETITELTENLIDLSNQTLIEVIPQYLAGHLAPFDQDKEQAPTYSRRLTKDDGIMDFKKSAQILEREVRAYLGWPKSVTHAFGHKIIVTKARVAKGQEDGGLAMKANPGWLEIQELIAPSGRLMSGAEFIRGYKKA